MKKRLLILLSVLVMIALLPACGGKENATVDAPQASGSVNTADGEMPVVVNTGEYTLYQNIFYNDTKADYAGKDTVKEGTFATIYDAFNDVTRYYVWGYNDWTKCCDWQWELKPDDTSALPVNGSLVTVTGTYEENEDALDKFWIIHPEVTVKETFDGRDFDVDMQAMGSTLERVQSINIVRNAEAFEGKTVCAYGRIKDQNTLEDPYYDNSWTITLDGEYEVPAFGTLVLVTGTIRDGSIINCKIEENTQY